MIAKTTGRDIGLFVDTQNINLISVNVAKRMNIHVHQHLKIMTVKHILNIQEVSIENKKSKIHNNS